MEPLKLDNSAQTPPPAPPAPDDVAPPVPEPDTAPPSSDHPARSRPVTWLRRCGCVLGLLSWLVLFLTPCLCFVPLFVNGEVTVPLGNRPGQEARLFRLSEQDARGIGLSWGRIQRDDAGAYCIRTEVRYVMWEGDAEATGYCQCYQQAGDDWQLTETLSANCQDAPDWERDATATPEDQ